MDIYKHLVYNPHMEGIQSVIQKAQDKSNLESGPEWQFVRSQPITEYEWVAIFEKWENENVGTPTPNNNRIQSVLEQIYLQATELSRRQNQVVGEMNNYYITLGQLESTLEKFNP